MDENQKRAWDSYEMLRKAASERFFDRRKIEFRVLMAFWAAIAALIVLILRQEVKEWSSPFSLVMTILAGLSLLAWIAWTSGINRANRFDQKVSRYFEAKMMALVNLEFTEEIKSWDERFDGRVSFMSIWSHQLQLAITALLLAGLVFVCWSKKSTISSEPTKASITSAAGNSHKP